MPGASTAYRPPQRLQQRPQPTRRRRRRRLKPWAKLFLAICIIIALLGLWSLVSRLLQPGSSRELHPVIQGVRDQISISETEDIQAALLNGVTAVDEEDPEGRRFPVQIYIYDEAGGRDPQNCTPGTYRVVYLCESGSTRADPVECILTVLPADSEGPVITGAVDLFVDEGGTVSYRSGVTAEDAVDGPVQLQVDTSEVNLNEPGIYHVTYSATDSSGNTTEVIVTLTVIPASTIGTGTSTSSGLNVTQAQLDELADSILNEITTSNMTKREKARAIYDYVYSCVTYVGTSDKTSWVTGAYVGFTQGRGDCFNYFACSKELLTRAGIPNIDLSRTGGTTDHYWQLVNVGDGWYHFDACPHPNSFPLQSFLLTEAEVRDYTERCSSVRKNYYVYDYDACPVTVEGTPAAELPAASPSPSPSAPELPNPSGGKVGQAEIPPVTPAPAETTPSIPDPELENTPPSETIPDDPVVDDLENPTDDLFEDPSTDPAEGPPEPEDNPPFEETGE